MVIVGALSLRASAFRASVASAWFGPLELAVSPHSILVAVTTAFWDHPGLELLHVRGATRRARLDAGAAPFAPAFTHNRRHLLVTGGEQDGALRILAAPDFARVRVVALGRVPAAAAPAAVASCGTAAAAPRRAARPSSSRRFTS